MVFGFISVRSGAPRVSSGSFGFVRFIRTRTVCPILVHSCAALRSSGIFAFIQARPKGHSGAPRGSSGSVHLGACRGLSGSSGFGRFIQTRPGGRPIHPGPYG